MRRLDIFSMRDDGAGARLVMPFSCTHIYFPIRRRQRHWLALPIIATLDIYLRAGAGRALLLL